MKAIEITKPRQGRKHRVHSWFDTQSMEQVYGVQCNVTSGKWAHVVEGDAVFLTTDRPTAAARAKKWSAPAEEQAP